jgi:hypothetical protein
VLELNSGRRRKGAASRYAVDRLILKKIGELAATKGGDSARKAQGANIPYTAAERHWLEVTMQRLILRAAEVAGDPSQNFAQITMADLPSLP